MGWITAGNLKIYTISDIISEFTIAIINIAKTLFTPFLGMIIALFFIIIIIYMFFGIRSKIKEVTLQ